MVEVTVVPEAEVQMEWGMVQWRGNAILVLGLGRVLGTVGPGLR